MHKKDILVRQLEEFGKVLAVILGFKKQQDWEKFQQEIAEATKRFTAFEINDIEGMLLDDFERKVVLGSEMPADQTKILAGLLFEKMDYYLKQNEMSKATDLKNKCILLYQKCAGNLTENEFDLDVHYKLEFLKK